MEYKNIDVKAIARLARLELDKTEEKRLEREMRQFDDFASCLSAFCCTDEEEYAAKPLAECTREDENLPSGVETEELISLSSGAKDGYISVPITVGKEDAEI